MTPEHGFVILDKPLGITSAKAVAEVKRLLQCKKIGHGGTLDPQASGILPLAIGDATKAFDYIAHSTKEYRFTVTFGQERDTDDAEGAVTAATDTLPTRDEIMNALPSFIGTIMQTPPAYSALKIDGERAYKRARAGEQVEMAARPVDIYSLQLEGIGIQAEGIRIQDSGFSSNNSSLNPESRILTPEIQNATFTASCGKGTYIRSLGRDIARKVKSMGYISALRRTRVGKFHEAQAISLDKLGEVVHNVALFEAWVPIELALDDIPAISVDFVQARMLRHGQAIRSHQSDGRYMALHEGRIVALVESGQDTLRSLRVFNV